MQQHLHIQCKLHNKSDHYCSYCKMPQVWSSSTALPVVSPGESTLPSTSLPSSTPLQPTHNKLLQDSVQHRLHCQISDCVQCRCDSGYYNMTFKCSPPSPSLAERTILQGCGYGHNNDHHHLHNDNTAMVRRHRCQPSSSKTTMSHRYNVSSSLSTYSPSTSHPSSEDESYKKCCCSELCQYCCCVCTINTSSICSDFTTRATSVSSSHVCSCTCKTLNLQPETNNNNQCTIPNSTYHRRECSCLSWNFLQTAISSLAGRLRRPQRRRPPTNYSLHGWEKMTSFLYTFVTVATFCLSFLPISDACSSRSTPKPRPPSPTLRPNITIQTYTCPPEYDAHYCLNGATCFTVKIGESILYNCECAEGYMGQRCEFKDLDGSYLPSKQRAMLEQAGLTSGAAIIVVIVVIVCFYLYVRSRRKSEFSQRLSRDVTDGMEYMGYETERRPFSGYYHSPTHNPHHHHRAFHSPTSNINSSHHPPHPQQTTKQHQPLPVCVSSSPSDCSDQEHIPPSPTLLTPPPIYQQKVMEPSSQGTCTSP